MPIWGWDASDFDWQRGSMDIGAAVRDGITFFSHKATEGTKTQHVHYAEALNRARAAAMPLIGAYMVVRTPGNNSHGSVQAQVNYFLAYLDAQTPWWRQAPEFYIQVDLEHWGYDDVAPQHGVLACDLLRARTGRWVVLYAPRWAYGDTIGGDHPLWASAYGSNPTGPYRQAYPGDGNSGWAPYSGRTPTILQYGSSLTIGSQPSCDANAFRGTVEQLRDLIIGGDMPEFGTVLTNGQDRSSWDNMLWTGYYTDQKVSGAVDRIEQALAAERVRDAAEATAIAGLRSAIAALAAAINAGGGGVDAAAINARVDAATAEVKALVEQRHGEERTADEQRHAEEMTAMRCDRDARIAALEAELLALRPAVS